MEKKKFQKNFHIIDQIKVFKGTAVNQTCPYVNKGWSFRNRTTRPFKDKEQVRNLNPSLSIELSCFLVFNAFCDPESILRTSNFLANRCKLVGLSLLNGEKLVSVFRLQ